MGGIVTVGISLKWTYNQKKRRSNNRRGGNVRTSRLDIREKGDQLGDKTSGGLEERLRPPEALRLYKTTMGGSPVCHPITTGRARSCLPAGPRQKAPLLSREAERRGSRIDTEALEWVW